MNANINDPRDQYDNWLSNNPAKWVLSQSALEYFSKNQVTTKLVDIHFKKTFRKIGKYNRKLPRKAFFRILLNGEVKLSIVIGFYILNLKTHYFVSIVYCLLPKKPNLVVPVLDILIGKIVY